MPARGYPPGRKQATRLSETDVSYLVAEKLQYKTIWRANMGETCGGYQPFSRWGKPPPCYEDCQEAWRYIYMQLNREIYAVVTFTNANLPALSLPDQPGIGLTQPQEESGAAHKATANRELVAELPIQRLGSPIKNIEGVSQPWGMAVRDNGEIVVAEYGSHCISIFAPNGKKMRTFGTLGSAQGQFYHPIGVEVGSGGNIIVVDGWNHRIQKFTAEGKFLTAVGRNGCAHLEFNFPAGIGINPNNKKVYVCDCHNHRVQILNEDLTFSSSFGNLGSGDGHFNYPWDVAFDNTGSTYIADSLNNRIQVFTPEGKFLRKFGKQGSDEGELNWPSSVSIDSNDRVYVADREVNHRVSIFTSQGEFVRLFGTEGARPGQFNYPHGIAVDKSGLVYVSNCNNHRVEIFECQHSTLI